MEDSNENENSIVDNEKTQPATYSTQSLRSFQKFRGIVLYKTWTKDWKHLDEIDDSGDEKQKKSNSNQLAVLLNLEMAKDEEDSWPNKKPDLLGLKNNEIKKSKNNVSKKDRNKRKTDGSVNQNEHENLQDISIQQETGFFEIENQTNMKKQYQEFPNTNS